MYGKKERKFVLSGRSNPREEYQKGNRGGGAPGLTGARTREARSRKRISKKIKGEGYQCKKKGNNEKQPGKVGTDKSSKASGGSPCGNIIADHKKSLLGYRLGLFLKKKCIVKGGGRREGGKDILSGLDLQPMGVIDRGNGWPGSLFGSLRLYGFGREGRFWGGKGRGIKNVQTILWRGEMQH